MLRDHGRVACRKLHRLYAGIRMTCLQKGQVPLLYDIGLSSSLRPFFSPQPVASCRPEDVRLPSLLPSFQLPLANRLPLAVGQILSIARLQLRTFRTRDLTIGSFPLLPAVLPLILATRPLALLSALLCSFFPSVSHSSRISPTVDQSCRTVLILILARMKSYWRKWWVQVDWSKNEGNQPLDLRLGVRLAVLTSADVQISIHMSVDRRIKLQCTCK